MDNASDMDMPSGEYRKHRRWKTVRLVILVAILLLLLYWLFYYTSLIPVQFMPRFSNSFQAVFLSNGQVYFGKLYRQDSQFPVLRDVYYLQVTQPPQQLQPGQNPPTNINLVKLGSELHGPQDEMRINRDQILFVEDMKPDSKVATAILQLETPSK